MMLQVLRAKIQRAIVTDADLHYEGSIGIDENLLEASGLLPYEKVHVLNINNGARAETYIIKGKRGSGEIVMNGAIARLAQVGDPVIILSYGLVTEDEAKTVTPTVVLVNEKNQIVSVTPQREN